MEVLSIQNRRDVVIKRDYRVAPRQLLRIIARAKGDVMDGPRAHPTAHQFWPTQKVHKCGWAAAAGAKALAPCLVAKRLIIKGRSEQSRRTLWRLDT
jgi:hypothetical protein